MKRLREYAFDNPVGTTPAAYALIKERLNNS